MKLLFKYDDRGFKNALKQYLDIRKNVDPKKEIRRRAKNISMRLIRIYKGESPGRGKIASDVKALGYKVKIRQALKSKGLTKKQQIASELRLRQNANNFTATGWFPGAEKLGAKPKVAASVQGPRRGTIQERLNTSKKSITLENQQPAAELVEQKAGGAVQKAIEQERDDMLKYVMRKQSEAAKRAQL